MNRALFATAAAIALATATGAYAHELDVDADGLVSLAELQAELPDMTQEQYDALDTNGDGALELEEVTAAIDSGALILPED